MAQVTEASLREQWGQMSDWLKDAMDWESFEDFVQANVDNGSEILYEDDQVQGPPGAQPEVITAGDQTIVSGLPLFNQPLRNLFSSLFTNALAVASRDVSRGARGNEVLNVNPQDIFGFLGPALGSLGIPQVGVPQGGGITPGGQGPTDTGGGYTPPSGGFTPGGGGTLGGEPERRDQNNLPGEPDPIAGDPRDPREGLGITLPPGSVPNTPTTNTQNRPARPAMTAEPGVTGGSGATSPTDAISALLSILPTIARGSDPRSGGTLGTPAPVSGGGGDGWRTLQLPACWC